MKIREIHIFRFGCIDELDLEIKDNMNFFYGLSEAKKSCVVDFVSVMFYGTINNKNEDVRANYIYADGSDMAGSITFEHKGENYLLERVFHAGLSRKDKLKFVNLTTEKEEAIPSGVDPGEHIFKINREIFMRNAYVNESKVITSLEQTSDTKIMSELLSNLISTAAEDISVSNVAKTLNFHSDTSDEKSLAYILTKKKEKLEVLKQEIAEATETEKSKMELQKHCNELQSKFHHGNKKYEKLSSGLALQDMLLELDSLQNTDISQEDFTEISDEYNKKKAESKKNGVYDHKKEFEKCIEQYEHIKSIRSEKKKWIQKKKNLSVELGRYMPKNDADVFENIVDTQRVIGETNNSINTLEMQIRDKTNEREQLKETLSQARFQLQTAENDLEQFDDVARRKISNAEEKLHNASFKVETEPVKKSKNLILAIILLFILFGATIVFITNIPVLIFLIIGIITCLYAIFSKVGKEKTVKNVRRVDENELRAAHMDIRNIKNQCNAERDRYNAKITYARKSFNDIKRRDDELKKQLESLQKEIAEARNKLELHMNQKYVDESKINPPDPKFYSLKSDIGDIESQIEKCDKEIDEISQQLLSDLSVMKHFDSFDDASKYIEENIKLTNELKALGKKLSIYNSRKNLSTSDASTEKRVYELKQKINIASKGKPIKKLSDKEYDDLKKYSEKLLEETNTIKDEYINTITNMKIQYNDCKSIACLDREVSELESEIKELEEKLRLIRASIDVYNDSLYEVREKYVPAVAKRTSEILAELTNEKYSAISMKSGKIIIKDKNKNSVNFEKISKSTTDQIYLSLRLAVAEVTSQKENFPVILDDIFLRFYDTKASQLLNFLIKYSERSQVIIFSTQNQISSVIAQEQISLKDLNMMSLGENSQ